MSLEVIKNEGDKSLLRELESFGLKKIESEILFILLYSEEPMTTKKLKDYLNVAKHQLYGVLIGLEKRGLLEQIGLKPKQYISDGLILKNSIERYEHEISVKCNALRNSLSASENKIYLSLGFDEDAKKIHQYLVKVPATRNELIKTFSEYSYEKIRNICESLLYQNAITKTFRGKSLLYSGLSLNEIVEFCLKSLKNKLDDKKERLKRILEILEIPTTSDQNVFTDLVSKTYNVYEDISSLVFNHSQEATEILSSLFVLIDHNFKNWKEIVISELKNSIKLCFAGIHIKWLVDKSFLNIFHQLSIDLKEQVVNAFPRLSIRVVTRFSTKLYIIDEKEFFEVPQTTRLLDKTLYIKSESATKIKRFDFLDIWEHSHDFLPIFNDSIDEDELIYFSDQKDKLMKLKNFNIAFLGNKGVGKTSIVNRYLTDKWDPQIRVTLGILVDESYIKVPKRTKEEYEEIKLVIYDYGGQELFRELYSGQLTGKECVALIFSMNESESFNDLEYWIGLIPEEDYKNQIVILVGSKSDLPNIMNQDKIWDFRKKYNIEYYFETSALLGKNIKKLFQELAEVIYEKNL